MSKDGGLIGMNYYKNSERGDITWDDLKSFCLCLGGPSLSAILKRLCQTPAHRSGLPDIAGKFSGKTFTFLVIRKK